VKKLKEKIIGQSAKYPKTGPHLDFGEEYKMNTKLLPGFISINKDLLYINETLLAMR
jgi:hypothetical protein